MLYVILCVILISAIPFSFSKEAETCSSLAVTDMNHTEIDVDSYCSDNPCLVKCCGQNEVIHMHRVNGSLVTHCKNIDVLKKEFGKILNITDFSSVPFDYSDIPFYHNNIDKNIKVSAKKFSDFTLLQRSMFKHPPVGRKCADQLDKMSGKLLEKGTLMQYKKNQYEYWTPKKTGDFCVDMSVGISVKMGLVRHDPYYMIRTPDINKMSDKNYYTAICLTISAFFLFLVLVVYSLLHQLRNIQGMLLCAYVATLFALYAIKATLLFKCTSEDQTVITEILYFLVLASFFWLKLMSFDIWWTFRGTRKHRAIHRRGINVKFLIYASYAFGVPAAMTIFASIMDKRDLPEHVVKPFFSNGFLNHSMLFYLYIPLLILTSFNCLLFVMTVYNIWLIRRNLASFDKNTVSKNKTNQNRFMLFIKLFSIMGGSWILELVQITMDPDEIDVWLDILINGYNLLIGVVIFFLFIFKTSIFLMLCKRFNLENRWTRRAYAVNSTRSEFSKTSKSDSSKNYTRTRSTTDSDFEDGENIKIRQLGYDKNTTEGNC